MCLRKDRMSSLLRQVFHRIHATLHFRAARKLLSNPHGQKLCLRGSRQSLEAPRDSEKSRLSQPQELGSNREKVPPFPFSRQIFGKWPHFKVHKVVVSLAIEHHAAFFFDHAKLIEQSCKERIGHGL